ncbi:hypothetical protein ASPZODRAFT_155051 [Penicilliopsis zonata CBS 506.65]|uniref:ABC transporter domain-containing protein n=1 Tax=Penicilliopsis zonata CBS 506.65 TaxID=1073090 RepID=A0A1L9S6J1_9EURO|nr:hypothetical protein ASPZODRAFT_155051 [Penicilliopsis zonata CBS 506.65]OJJ42786.1 hypothetical protein ASPZODRAFT_155051 [Penicilliopsis zonata CBS 506.65]
MEAIAVVVVLGSIPSLRRLIASKRRRKQSLYDDADGVASDASLEAFSNRRSFTALFLFASLGLGLVLTVSRRPDVYRDGKVVDQEMTGSLFSRWSLNWVEAVRQAGDKETLETTDFPALPTEVCTQHGTEAFDDIILNDSLPLWMRLTWQFRKPLLVQWGSILITNFFDVAPSFAALQLLRHLEARGDNLDAPDPDAWKYVLAILAAELSSQLGDSRVNWWEIGTIVVPLRSTLAGVMYRKLLRRSLHTDDSHHHDDNHQDTDESEEKEEKNAEDVVNMFAVDCEQIAEFAAMTAQYVNTAGKFAVTSVFLFFLMGWESLCAGLLGIVLLFPINRALSSRYGKKQTELMKIRDHRTAVTTEALHGIRQIKFSASEDQWARRLGEIRDRELHVLWKTRLDSLYMTIASEFTPIALTALSLSTYAYIHGELGPAVAFTAISLVLQLEGVVSHVPYLLVMLMDAKVSCERIDRFLRAEEKPVSTHPGPSVAFHDATIAFPSSNKDRQFTLAGLNLTFPAGALSVISGPTGSGKSLLLAAILGEAKVLQGAIHVPSSATGLAFVSQSPWLENASVRDNILFGLPFDALRYSKAIAACALTADLSNLPDRDETLVGPQGVALSGGQKWRVTLARALYSRAGILVLDDVFSALDAHVGRHVLEQAIHGDLAQGRTRILATHHAAMVQAAYSVRLAGGVVEYAGDEVATVDSDGEQNPGEMETFQENEKAEGDVEGRETGRVSTEVYKGYLSASGGWSLWTMLVLCFALSEAFIVGRTYWVKIWSGQKEMTISSGPHLPDFIIQSAQSIQSASPNHSLWYYLGIYCLISSVSVIITLGRLLLVYTASIKASRNLFTSMLHTVLHTPLRWLDTIPPGRILNRFTADFRLLDSSLAEDFYQLAGIGWSLAGIMISAVFVSWIMAVVAAVLLLISALIARQYLTAARSIKRLEATSKSPVISHFSTSLRGLATIRAFDMGALFISRMDALIDTYAACTWYDGLLRGWLLLRVGITAMFLSVAVAICVVSMPGVDASLAGFALSFALNFSFSVAWMIRTATEVELDMNAAERIIEYRDLVTEPAGGDVVRASWPEHGRVEVSDLEVGYADGLPSILKGLSFTVEPNQRIGVVGRTGAGKSTLSLALFRFLEARQGRITIDGMDISRLRLDDLRTRLAIIPQDPVLFSGTIRSNLDPLERFSDEEVRDALERVHLPASSTAAGASLSLTSPIASGGNNLSQGQKQLLCLARAILTRPKILVLDEATSAVDSATDRLIQQSIRESFTETTLLVVAHRLSTVADFDRILVLQDGVAAEFGRPDELIAAGGVFASMWDKN